MSVELLYTSSELGLKQGSRGFCTVISTAGMPINLANRLESLSGYRHIFQPGTAEAAQNPIAFSHLRLSVGGRVVSILSRVADYGLDYSQRTNKIAHHLVLDPTEFASAGPAWVMRQRGVFRDVWDGKCSTPNIGPSIPLGDKIPAVCTEWHSVSGDAGWAGVLAENLSRRSDKPFWIIFSVEQSKRLLTLMDEAIALLPAQQRWEATFSTYATTIPPDIDCRVRCVLQGSNEARLAPARGQVIDLTKPLPLTLVHAFISLAREGRAATSPTAIPNISKDLNHSGVSETFSTGLPQMETSELVGNLERSWQTALGHQDESQLQPTKGKLVTPPRPPAVPENRVACRSGQNRATRKAILALVCSAVLLVIASAFTWYAMEGNGASTSTASASKANGDSREGKPDSGNSITDSVSNETSNDADLNGDPSQTAGPAQAQGSVQVESEGAKDSAINKELSEATTNPHAGKAPKVNDASSNADQGNSESAPPPDTDISDNSTNKNAAEQKESPKDEQQAAGKDKDAIAPAEDGPNTEIDNAFGGEDPNKSITPPSELKSSYVDGESIATPIKNLDRLDWWRGKFRLESTLETKPQIVKLYYRLKNGSHRNIEMNPILIDEQSAEPILKGRYTLSKAKFLKDKNVIHLEVDVNINDKLFQDLRDRFQKLIKRYKETRPSWPQSDDFPRRLDQKQFPKFVTNLDSLKNKIEAERAKYENPDPTNQGEPKIPAQVQLPPVLEAQLEIVNDFLKLRDDFNNHRAEFAKSLITHEPLVFNEAIFLSADPSDSESWEPLQIRLKPVLPVSF